MTTTITSDKPGRIPGLDGIRALAILMVLCAHFISGSTSNWLLKTLARNGGYGVEVFFILSGFLITILILREEKKWGTFSIREFYLRRTLRILPPLLVFLASLSIMNSADAIKITLSDIPACLFFMRNYFGQSQVTEHIWTLSIEEQYYILLPIFLITIKSNKIRLGFLLAIIFSLSPWRQYCYSIPDTNWRRTDLKLEPLLIGSVFAISREAVFPKFMTNNFFSGTWAFLSSLLVISASFSISKIDSLWGQSLRTTAIYFAMATLINCASLGKVWLVSDLLATKPIVWLGQISYSLYIWQQLFSPFDNRVNLSWYTFFPQNIILACLFGAISFYLVELPINLLKFKLLKTKFGVSQ